MYVAVGTGMSPGQCKKQVCEERRKDPEGSRDKKLEGWHHAKRQREFKRSSGFRVGSKTGERHCLF